MGIIENQQKTFFAPARRSSLEEIELQVETVSQHPVLNALLDMSNGFLAVLNENRQIIAVNEQLLDVLGVENTQEVFGLRPGEALHCEHSDTMPGGCGTSLACSSCGAAIAIVSAIHDGHPAERTCALRATIDNKTVDLFFSVRSQLFLVEDRKFILLFLQDITKRQQWITLERIFFHDTNNILTGLVGASDLLARYDQCQDTKLLDNIRHLSARLTQELRIQQSLSKMDTRLYQSVSRKISTAEIYQELQSIFYKHEAVRGREINFSQKEQLVTLQVDECVLIRILNNMITNALEATSIGGCVRVWIEEQEGYLVFSVWNQEYIPPAIAIRIFQRNFSTKGELGRGLGTYSMKLFGESILGGEVDFVTSEQHGTTFYLKLPINTM